VSGSITHASAVLALREYYLENHRFPKAYECNAANELPHYTTYLRLYATWSAATTAALNIVSVQVLLSLHCRHLQISGACDANLLLKTLRIMSDTAKPVAGICSETQMTMDSVVES